MALKGAAFLAIWHDITPGRHEAYIDWHTREHMPERLSIPGFRTGKRLHAPHAGRHVFGTIYSGDTLDVFRSVAYLERLNTPPPWTAEIAPSFENFLRIACERIAQTGQGDGGTMATICFDFSQDLAAGALRHIGQALVEEIHALPGVCAAHLGLAHREVSSQRTRETELRAAMAEREFDAVLLIEGSVAAGLGQSVSEVERRAVATGLLRDPRSALYEVAYTLGHLDAEEEKRAPAG